MKQQDKVFRILRKDPFVMASKKIFECKNYVTVSVAVALASFANITKTGVSETDRNCWPSQVKIGKLIGLSRKHVGKQIQILEKKNLIKRKKQLGFVDDIYLLY